MSRLGADLRKSRHRQRNSYGLWYARTTRDDRISRRDNKGRRAEYSTICQGSRGRGVKGYIVVARHLRRKPDSKDPECMADELSIFDLHTNRALDGRERDHVKT
jgi:hypothetical protein